MPVLNFDHSRQSTIIYYGFATDFVDNFVFLFKKRYKKPTIFVSKNEIIELRY